MNKIGEKISKILVATDFSEGAQRAFAHACLFAREFKSEVILFHVCGTYGQELSHYPSMSLESLGIPPLPSLARIAEKEMDEFLKKQNVSGIQVRREIQELGPVSHQVKKFCKSEGVDLVVIGSHGRTGLDRFTLGSIAERILKHVNVPVLVSREKHAPSSSRIEETYQRILIATDLSQHSEFALTQGLKLAKRLNAQVDLLHVVDERIFTPLRPVAVQSMLDEFSKELEKDAREKMEAYISGFTNSKDFLNLQVVVGTPATKITELAEKLDADLVILGSHGHLRISDFFLGSTAERVAQRSPSPLLVVK